MLASVKDSAADMHYRNIRLGRAVVPTDPDLDLAALASLLEDFFPRLEVGRAAVILIAIHQPLPKKIARTV
jgi:hypothetical protein